MNYDEYEKLRNATERRAQAAFNAYPRPKVVARMVKCEHTATAFGGWWCHVKGRKATFRKCQGGEQETIKSVLKRARAEKAAYNEAAKIRKSFQYLSGVAGRIFKKHKTLEGVEWYKEWRKQVGFLADGAESKTVNDKAIDELLAFLKNRKGAGHE